MLLSLNVLLLNDFMNKTKMNLYSSPIFTTVKYIQNTGTTVTVRESVSGTVFPSSNVQLKRYL